MSVHTKKTFAWLWIAALLSSTVGVSMHTIYCYCTDHTTLSFFEPSGSDCEAKKKTVAGACCSKKALPKKSCCQTGALDATECTWLPDEPDAEQAFSSFAYDDNDKNCTHKSTVVFQMKAEFLVEKPFEKDFEFPLWLEEMPFLKRLARPALCQIPYQSPVAEPPPPESGRVLCIRHQCFLC